jgi:hypothetical protein
MRWLPISTCALVSCVVWGAQLGCTARALAPPEDAGLDASRDFGHDLGLDLAPDLSIFDFAGQDLARNLCPAGTNFIYTIDANTTLSRFSPASGAFFDVGTIACPTMLGGSPNSMAVDRQGNAWVNYSSGELFRLLTQTLTCTSTPFPPGQAGEPWGMSFAENTPGSTDETLFIAETETGSATLAQLNVTSFALSNEVGIQGDGTQPELTGDDQANLFGFFPGSAPPFIARINKQTGALDRTLTLGPLAGSPEAWGMAAYQGSFYVFLQRQGDQSTNVYRVDAMTGALNVVVNDTGREIVGVGVATCAGNGLDGP